MKCIWLVKVVACAKNKSFFFQPLHKHSPFISWCGSRKEEGGLERMLNFFMHISFRPPSRLCSSVAMFHSTLSHDPSSPSHSSEELELTHRHIRANTIRHTHGGRLSNGGTTMMAILLKGSVSGVRWKCRKCKRAYKESALCGHVFLSWQGPIVCTRTGIADSCGGKTAFIKLQLLCKKSKSAKLFPFGNWGYVYGLHLGVAIPLISCINYYGVSNCTHVRIVIWQLSGYLQHVWVQVWV